MSFTSSFLLSSFNSGKAKRITLQIRKYMIKLSWGGRMLIREKYLNKIRHFYDETSLIKIIYGLRRSGKSVILTQIINEIKQKGIDDNHIIYINFESLDYSHIKTAKDLNDYIKSLAIDKEKYYVFLDEVQKVEEFEKGVNSLRITEQFSIFITGSNSKMTFLLIYNLKYRKYLWKLINLNVLLNFKIFFNIE